MRAVLPVTSVAKPLKQPPHYAKQPTDKNKRSVTTVATVAKKTKT